MLKAGMVIKKMRFPLELVISERVGRGGGVIHNVISVILVSPVIFPRIFDVIAL